MAAIDNKVPKLLPNSQRFSFSWAFLCFPFQSSMAFAVFCRDVCCLPLGNPAGVLFEYLKLVNRVRHQAQLPPVFLPAHRGHEATAQQRHERKTPLLWRAIKKPYIFFSNAVPGFPQRQFESRFGVTQSPIKRCHFLASPPAKLSIEITTDPLPAPPFFR